jgi:hypothetical protein
MFRACAEAEDAGHDMAQLLGQRDFPPSAAIGAARMVVELNVGVEGR